MKTHTAETSPLVPARVAGLLYLMVIPLGIFALYVSSTLIVAGDSAATAANIRASETLFRLGMVSDMLAPIILMVVVLFLYRLLRPISKNLAVLMVMFLLAGVPIALLNKLNQFAALHLVSGADYLTVFTPEQLQALMYQSLRLHNHGSHIAFIFWGLWLFPLGYLVFRSGFLPRILGVLLMVACLGYLIDSFAAFLGYSVGIGLYTALGEALFPLWLLIKGVNGEQWAKRVREAT
jgi:hypothetical protein